MWLLIGPALAFLLLAAHFLRAEVWLLVGLSLALIPLLAVPRPWAAHLARIALVAGALEWVRTLTMIAAIRFSAGISAWRMILILGVVAVLTLLATLVFEHRRLRGFYRLAGGRKTGNPEE